MHTLIRTTALGVTAVAVLVMMGWFLDIELLKSIVPGLVTMKFSTALSFLMAGLIVFFSHSRIHGQSDWADIVLPSVTLIILILMGTTLLSVVIGFESGIESLFVREDIDAVLTTVPGQPSIGTMVAFLIIGVLALLGITDWQRKKIAYVAGGIGITLLGSIALLGYLISNPLLYYTIADISSAMAVHTAVLFVAIGTAYILLGRIPPAAELQRKP